MKIDLLVNRLAYGAMRAGTNITDTDAVLSALEWWREAGIDVLVGDEPFDWLSRRPPEPAVRAAPVPAPAALPDTLEAFQSWLTTSPDAPEARWGAGRIAPAGDAAAGLMIVTDLPDPEDAAEARLLAGAPGRLFDRMLAAIGRDRDAIYLAPLASVRPIGGRVDEASLTRLAALMRHHIALVRPKRLLLLGDAPSRAMLGTGFLAARGRLHSINHQGIKVDAVASFHPRQLLRQPSCKAEAWRDLLLLTGDSGL